jgi:hypothetical protein
MPKNIMRVMCAAITLAAALCIDAPGAAGLLGTPHRAREYRTFAACYPNAFSDRGFCNVNRWPGPTTTNTVAHLRHLKRYARQHEARLNRHERRGHRAIAWRGSN